MDSKLPGIAALPTLSQNANPKENKTCELYNDLTASIEVNEGNSEYLVYPFQSLKLNGQQMTIRLQEAPQISFSYDSLVGRLVVSALSDFGPKALEHLEVEDRELLVEKQRRQKRRQKMRKHFKMERLGLVVVLCCFLWPCLSF